MGVFGRKKPEPAAAPQPSAAETKAIENHRLAEEINAKIRAKQQQKTDANQASKPKNYRKSIFGSQLSSEKERINQMINAKAEKQRQAAKPPPKPKQAKSPSKPRARISGADSQPQPTRISSADGSIRSRLSRKLSMWHVRTDREQLDQALKDDEDDDEGATLGMSQALPKQKQGPADDDEEEDTSAPHPMQTVVQQLSDLQQWVNTDPKTAQWGDAKLKEFADKLQELAYSAKGVTMLAPITEEEESAERDEEVSAVQKFVADVGNFSRRLFSSPADRKIMDNSRASSSLV